MTNPIVGDVDGKKLSYEEVRDGLEPTFYIRLTEDVPKGTILRFDMGSIHITKIGNENDLLSK